MSLSTNQEYLVKGTAVMNLRNYLESKETGIFERLAKEFHFPTGSMVIPSSWYQAESIYLIQEKAGECFGLTPRQVGVEVARYSLEVDLAGVYRLFMKIGGAKLTLQKLPALGSRYVNYFNLELVECTDSKFVGDLTVASDFAERSLWSNEGAIAGVLKVCGGSLLDFSILGESTVSDLENYMKFRYVAKF